MRTSTYCKRVLGHFPDRHFPTDISPIDIFPTDFPRRTVPRRIVLRRTISRTDISPTDSSPNEISPNGHFPESHFFIYLNLFYRWYTKVTEANEFLQKNINTNNKLYTVVKLTYLQVKHPQSIFPRFLGRRQRCPIRSVLLVIIGW